MKYTDDELIEAMMEFYDVEGTWPKLRDMKSPYPSRSVYADRFATKDGKQDGFCVALKMAQERYCGIDSRPWFTKLKSRIMKWMWD